MRKQTSAFCQPLVRRRRVMLRYFSTLRAWAKPLFKQGHARFFSDGLKIDSIDESLTLSTILLLFKDAGLFSIDAGDCEQNLGGARY